jgi:DNA mismatch endonuclease (patch repair protein)
MHPKIEGSPDLIIPGTKTAVFLNGCFWHKCRKCFVRPESRPDYWDQKIDKNVERDKENAHALRSSGWNVVVFWEHDIRENWDRIENRLWVISR